MTSSASVIKLSVSLKRMHVIAVRTVPEDAGQASPLKILDVITPFVI